MFVRLKCFLFSKMTTALKCSDPELFVPYMEGEKMANFYKNVGRKLNASEGNTCILIL